MVPSRFNFKKSDPSSKTRHARNGYKTKESLRDFCLQGGTKNAIFAIEDKPLESVLGPMNFGGNPFGAGRRRRQGGAVELIFSEL